MVDTVSLGFPLLGKELVELAARRWTYIVRFLYAMGLFVISFSIIYQELKHYRDAQAIMALGKGRELFQYLVALQCAGIYILLPLMICGVITEEKQRRSLSLLFITDLRPREILIQKLFSRLLPMFSFLLLSLPLMAVAYSYGGLESHVIAKCVYWLLLICLQIGMVGLAASAFCVSTTGAFILTYAMLGAMYFGPAFGMELLRMFRLSGFHPEIAFAMFPVFGMEGAMGGKRWDMLFMHSLPVWGTILFFFGVARLFLVRRAEAAHKNLLVIVFRWADRKFRAINNKLGGIEWRSRTAELPDANPIAWRETTRTGLGSFHYILRLVTLLIVPLFSISLLLVFWDTGEALGVLMVIHYGLWILFVLLLILHATGAVSRERSRQTLDVLLVMPLHAGQLIRGKIAGPLRVMWTLAVLLGISAALLSFWMSKFEDIWWRYSSREFALGWYVFIKYATIVLYLPTVMWLAFMMGLWLRSHLKAVVWTLGLVAAWCIGPIVAGELINEFYGYRFNTRSDLLFMLSPVVIFFINEGEMASSRYSPLLFVVGNFMVAVGVLCFTRWCCYRFADRWLGRVAEHARYEPRP